MTDQAPAKDEPAKETPVEDKSAQTKTPEEVAESNKLSYEDLLKESRKWEERAKKNHEKAEKWEEYETKLNPESSNRIKELEAELTELRTNDLRNQAAAKFSLPEALKSRLVGNTIEELEADAEILAQTFTQAGGQQGAGNTPAAKPVKLQGTQGSSGNSAGTIKSKEEFLAALKAQQ